jgi:hypothetical protein
MTDILFYGNPAELSPLLTHCTVHFLSRPSKFTSDSARCGYIGSRFRGKALDWLTASLESDPNLLSNYDTFTKKLKVTFDLEDDTQKLSAEQQLRNLRQTGSAQQYALKFDTLQAILKYGDEQKVAAFQNGLKQSVKQQLIGESWTNYTELRQTAVTRDAQLYAMRNATGKKGNRSKPPDKRSN